jgi:hypothetical protein
MSVYKDGFIWTCDACGQTVTEALPRRGGEQPKPSVEGWVLTNGRETALCPDCADELGAGALQTAIARMLESVYGLLEDQWHKIANGASDPRVMREQSVRVLSDLVASAVERERSRLEDEAAGAVVCPCATSEDENR